MKLKLPGMESVSDVNASRLSLSLSLGSRYVWGVGRRAARGVNGERDGATKEGVSIKSQRAAVPKQHKQVPAAPSLHTLLRLALGIIFKN